MGDAGQTSPTAHNNMFSREEVVKCPHMMALLGYLNLEHDIPKYGWKRHGLRYHYTDAAGLVGIIQSGRLWATDIRFLNDPSEGSFFPERLLAIMASKAGGCSGTELQIIEGVRKALHNPRSKLKNFCASLSADGDLLSQWRGYGGFGKGYSVGLNLHVAPPASPHPQIASFYDVVYGDDELPNVAFDLLDLFVSAETKWKDTMLDEWAVTLTVVAKAFKNICYAEEQESRLLCTHSDKEDWQFANELPIRFRARGGDIVPYIPMSLQILKGDEVPRLPIERIVVGPGVDFERNCDSIMSLLKANAYNDVKIERSRIPFRP